MVGAQRLPGAGDGAGDCRRWHLRTDEHAAGRTTGSVGRAGDRVHGVPGAGAPGGRGPGHLSADQRPARGAEIKGRPRLLVLRRLLHLRHLRRRHGPVLGALARAREPQRRIEKPAGWRGTGTGTRRVRRGLGLPVRAAERPPLAGRAARDAGLVPALPAHHRARRGRGRQRRRLRAPVLDHRRPRAPARVRHPDLTGVRSDRREQPRRRRPRDRNGRDRVHGPGTWLPARHRGHREPGAARRKRRTGADRRSSGTSSTWATSWRGSSLRGSARTPWP